MKTTVTTKNKANIILQSIGDSLFQILEYDELKGCINQSSINTIREINEGRISLKVIRVILKNSSIKIQNNSLNYMKGDIQIKDKDSNPISIAKRLLGSKEKNIKPYLVGTGEVFFKPSFNYFSIIELDDEEIVIDDDIFFTCEDSIKISTESSKNLLDTNKLRLKLSGSGIIILKLPVSENEIIRYKLFNDKLSVIGEYGVLRSGSVELEVEEISNISKEYKESDNKYINIYEGIGEVWLLPTLSCYENFDECVEIYNENDS